MSLQDIVKVQIDKQTAAISRAGFGTPMIMSSEADGLLATTTKIYGPDLAELTADGFATDGPTARKFLSLISQNPKVDKVVVGKRSNQPLKTLTITPIAKNTTEYSVTIGGVGPLATSPAETFTFTSDATATVAEITAGLVLAINGGSQNVLATDNTTDITVEKATTPGGAAAAGVSFSLTVNDRTLLEVQNITADPGVVADLNAIRGNADGDDDWYAAFLDNSGEAELLALAAAMESIPKLFLAVTSDADVLTAVTTDVGSVLQANNYARTALVWHQDPDRGPEGSWAGRALPFDPGSITWNLLANIAGAPATTFETSELNELKNKNVNRFVVLGGQTAPQEGKTTGGEFIDVTRGIDFITARLQENIFGQLLRLPKIPFTDAGIAIIENEVRGVMELGISNNIFTADPAPVVTVPRANDVDVNDRANRLLPDVNFSAQLAGAIHTVEVNGVVTV